MSAVEPLFSHHAATDVLKNLFSPANQGQTNNLKDGLLESAHHGAAGMAGQEAQAKSAKADEVNIADVPGDELDVPQAEAKEISAEPNDNVQIDHFITQPQQAEESDHVTKADLVRVLESFVNVIKETTEKHDRGVHANLPSPLNFEPQVAESMVEIIESKNAEIDELKSLLVEAQSTIITLLTDRVDDKAKIATFESQMRYLPDYERLHTPPGELPHSDSEELRADLTKVKAELQTIKNTAFKTSLDKPTKWPGFKAWLSKFVATTSA